MKENKREIELSFDFLRQAKKKTIHTLMSYGKEHPVLKYPMFAVTVVFIFIYNMFLHLFIQLHMREKLARGLAFAMSVILVLTSIDITAFAMSQKNDDFYRLTAYEEIDSIIEVPYGTEIEDIVFPSDIEVTMDFYTISQSENGTEVGGDEEKTPAGTELPSASATPEPTEEPGESENPEPTEEPGESENPEPTEEPGESGNPEPTEEPGESENPEPTEEPGESENPEPTEEPDESENPETAVEEQQNSDEQINIESVSYALETNNAGTGFPVKIQILRKEEDLQNPEEIASPAVTPGIVQESEETEETVETETYVETISAELPVTWECDEFDSKVPGEYIFTAKLPDEYEGYALDTEGISSPEITIRVLEAEATSLSQTVDGIEITLTAAPGVFPADARLSVTKIEDEESITKIEETIQNTLDQDASDEETITTVEKTITFDIVVQDGDGREIQPEIPEGMDPKNAVTVTFKQAISRLSVDISEDEEAQQTLEVYHIDDDMESAEQMNASTQGNDLIMNPEHFSLYSCTRSVTYAKGVYSWKTLYKAVYGKSGTVNIKLKDDIDIRKLSLYSNSDRLYIKNGQTVNLDLNGYSLISDMSGRPAIEVRDATLNIHDTRGNGRISSPYGDCVIYVNGGIVNLHGGSVYRDRYEDYGIYALNGASVNIKGGCIYGSFLYGIYFNSSYRGTGTMTSGSIDGANYGVYIGGPTNRGTTFDLGGGSIQNCKYAGIYNNSGTVYMSGGKISGNSGYKAYGIRNAGVGSLKLSGSVNFSNNRAADVYVGSSSTNYITVNSTLTGSRIGVETAVAPTKETPVQFTSNAVSMDKFYSAANSSYAVWQPGTEQYLVVGPAEDRTITVKPFNKKISTQEENMAGTVAIGTGTPGTETLTSKVKNNSYVTLKATLTNPEEYEFTGWYTNWNETTGTGNFKSNQLTYSFYANATETYTAVFTKKQVRISVEAPATNGVIRGSACITKYSLTSNYSQTESGTFEVGSTITIKATPSSSKYQFSQWNDGNKETERQVNVTETATYSAQFRLPPPSASNTGILYVNVQKVTSDSIADNSNVLLLFGDATMQESGNNVGVAGLPDGSAILKVDSGNTPHFDDYWNKTSPKSGYVIYPGSLSSSTSGTKVDVKTTGSGFDTCQEGLIRRYSDSWYYWCNAGGVKGIGKYSAYTYSQSANFTAGSIKASFNELKLRDENTVDNIDLTIQVTANNGSVYTLQNMIFQDSTIDFVSGKRMVELDLGGVLYTYVLPEAIVTEDESGETNKKEYTSLKDALKSAVGGNYIHVVGPAVSEIRGTTVTVQPNVTILSYDGSAVKTEGESSSQVLVDADGTIKLVKGTISVTPFTDSDSVKVGVGDSVVTAKKPITVTTDENGENGFVKTTTPTDEIVISPDGDPDHTVTYTGCPEGKEYGIHSGKLTDEEKVEIKEGTEYDLEVTLGENQKTNIETDGSNPGTTIITKGKKENGDSDGSIVIKSDKPNNDITVGDTKYTTNDNKTTLVIRPNPEEGGESKPEVELKEGSVDVPKNGSVTLPNGDKVTNSSSEGSEKVTVDSGNKISVPDGAEATIGEGDDALKISVPKGTPANLPAEVIRDKDGNYQVKAEPGNDVTIGNETYTIGDYDTTFKVETGEDGKPGVTVTDGGVELKPGQSVTDSNGVTFKNTGDKPIKLSMTEGENTEVTVGEDGSFTYQPAGVSEPIEYTNPGSSEADFSVSKDGDVSLNSDMDVPKGKDVDVNFGGKDVNVKVPDTNTGEIKIDPTEGTITIEKQGDKVEIGGEKYTASKPNTVLSPGKNGTELKEGGVTLAPSDSVTVGGTEIENSGNGQCEVTVSTEGDTKVTVPQKGGFTMKDPNSGESVSFTNPNSSKQEYKLDDSGSLVLPDDSDITFKQSNKPTKIGAEGGDVTIRPSENGVEITAPKNGSIKINDVSFENKGTGEELVIAVGSDGNPVLESGVADVPTGEQIKLAGGDTVTNKGGVDVTVGADGNIEMPDGSTVEIETGGKKNSYSAEEDTKLEYDPETGIPTLKNGSVSLGTGSSVGVIYNTIDNSKNENFDEEEKATITSTGKESPTVKNDGTITVPRDGEVVIDSEVKKGEGENAVKEKARNKVSVPKNAKNDTVSVKPNTDGSANITLQKEGDSITVNGMEYTTTKDNTEINITETGSTLTKGAVELDGGKTPREGINVNGTCVTNSGAEGSKVSVEAKDDGSVGFEVSPGGQFDLSVPGVTGSAVTFKNPGQDEASYRVETDGSIKLGGGSSISFKTGVGDTKVTGGDGVSMKVTEDGVALKVEAGKRVTVDGVTYEVPADSGTALTLTIDKDGKPVVTGGSAKVPQSQAVNVRKENGELLEIKKTGDDPDKGENDSIIVTADGAIKAYPGDTITIGEGTYTCQDNSGEFNLTVDPESGEVTVDKGAKIEVTNGNLTFKDQTNGAVSVSTTGDKTILVEKQASNKKPEVTIPKGGNATITNNGSEMEIKIPSDVTEDKKVTIGTDGSISVALKEGEQVTIGGIVYQAEKQGTVKVNGATGKLIESSITRDDSDTTPVIDPESFNKKNYEYKLDPGKSVKVGDVIYTAPEGDDDGMILLGNPDGNPVIQVKKKGQEIKVGDQTYTAGSDNTKFVVNSDNNVTLVDNENAKANSSLKVDGSKTMIIDGNKITSSGEENPGYTITKTEKGDSLDIEDGTKVSVTMGTEGSDVVISGKVNFNGESTTGDHTTIRPSSGGTGIVIDKTAKDEGGEYITNISSSGSTILTPVKDADGNIIGFTTKLPAPKPNPDPGTGSDKEDDDGSFDNDNAESEEEAIVPVVIATPTPKPVEKEAFPSAGWEADMKETSDKSKSDRNTSEGTVTEDDIFAKGTENSSPEPSKEEFEIPDIPVTGDVKVNMQEGSVSILNLSNDGNLSGNFKNIVEACFSPDEIEKIGKGASAKIRLSVVRISENIPDEDRQLMQLMQEQYEKYAESMDGLQLGTFFDIVVERKLDNEEWKQLHELNGEIELTVTIPDELLAEGRTYYMMRNHEGECVILNDLDSESATITIATSYFSSYAILYRDGNVENDNPANPDQTGNAVPWIVGGISVLILLLLLLIAFMKKRNKNEK